LETNAGIGNTIKWCKQAEINREIGFPTTPFEVYRTWKPQGNIDLLLNSREFIKTNKPVTVRHVYYHFEKEMLAINTLKPLSVHSTDEIKKLYLKNYKLTIRMLTRARLCGLIDANWIVDDTRGPIKTPSYDDINTLIRYSIANYRSDWQKNQAKYVEVWLEKRSLIRVIQDYTNFYDVYLVPGGGYQSTDAIDDAMVRIRPRIKKGQEVVILYFGDLNPSGKDMPRDIKDRLAERGIKVRMEEVALNQKDVIDFNLPMNPTKTSDARLKWFAEKYPEVTYSVELDALDPTVLRRKVQTAIENEVDYSEIQRCRASDEQEKNSIKQKLGIIT
jgi:hypothetical protein